MKYKIRLLLSGRTSISKYESHTILFHIVFGEMDSLLIYSAFHQKNPQTVLKTVRCHGQ